jgi:polygalacturonase
MEYGHGAVVVGSEMSGGVKNVHVEKCIFSCTDRGIRIKTRRGRGNTGIIDEIYASSIKMDHVKTPFTVNSFYFCDADGKSEYVWSKEKLPVDERTPFIGNIFIKDIYCTGIQVSAGFMYGLPESKIQKVVMENINIKFDKDAEADYPEMMSFIEPMCRSGFYFNNIKNLILKNIELENSTGDPVMKLNIDNEEIA